MTRLGIFFLLVAPLCVSRTVLADGDTPAPSVTSAPVSNGANGSNGSTGSNGANGANGSGSEGTAVVNPTSAAPETAISPALPVAATANPTPAVKPTASHFGPGRQAAIALFGGLYSVGTVVGLGVFFYGTSHGDAANQNATLADRNAQVQNGQTFNTAGAIVLGAAAACGLVAIIIGAVPSRPDGAKDKDSDKDKNNHASRLWIAPTSNGVLAGGSF